MTRRYKNRKKQKVNFRPKKRLNKNQKRMKGRYTNKENKKVDQSQEKRIKFIEKVIKPQILGYTITNPGYNNFIKQVGPPIVYFPYWNHNIGLNLLGVTDFSIEDCYHFIDVSPEIRRANWYTDEVTGQVTTQRYAGIPGLGSLKYIAQNIVSVPHTSTSSKVLHRQETCTLTSWKNEMHYSWLIRERLESLSGGVGGGFFPFETFVLIPKTFLVRVYLISQPIVSQGTSELEHIADFLPGPNQTKKESFRKFNRITSISCLASQADRQLATAEYKYKILSDQTIRPKFKQIFTTIDTTGATDFPNVKTWQMTINLYKKFFFDKKIYFDPQYGVDGQGDVNNVYKPSNLKLTYIFKFRNPAQASLLFNANTNNVNNQIVINRSTFHIRM